SITIKGVTADTTIISGVGANKYVLGKDENDVVTSQFLGTLFINNGEKWTATPGLLGAVSYIPTGIITNSFDFSNLGNIAAANFFNLGFLPSVQQLKDAWNASAGNLATAQNLLSALVANDHISLP